MTLLLNYLKYEFYDSLAFCMISQDKKVVFVFGLHLKVAFSSALGRALYFVQYIFQIQFSQMILVLCISNHI